MFGALLIGSSPERSRVIKNAAVEAQRVLPLRTLESYPADSQLVHLLNAIDPDLILLDTSNLDIARGYATLLSRHGGKSALIGFGDPAALRGDPLFPFAVSYPPETAGVARAVDAAMHSKCGQTERSLISFLPAKAGSGASTVAFNTAAALAAINRRVLLIETDLRSGVLATMAGAEPQYSIAALLRASAELDRFRVENAVTRRHGIDMLLMGRTACLVSNGRLPEWDDYYHLLEIVKSRYDHILVDLPESVNPATRELVQRSSAVHIVATPELLAIELAARRMKELADWKIPAARVSLLLNRWTRSELSSEEAERATGCRVGQTIPNDYVAHRRALSNGAPVAAGGAAGRAYRQFASRIPGPAAEAASAEAPALLRWLFTSK